MLIGIGGVSRSGKSTLANQLFAEATRQKRTVRILHQDTFVRPSNELPRIRDHIDWEVPASMNWPRLQESIAEASAKNDIIVVEGLFAFAHEAINHQYDRGICMHISRSIFEHRKLLDLRWGQEPHWYINHIWESYQQHGRPPAYLRPMTYIDGTVLVPPSVLRALLR